MIDFKFDPEKERRQAFNLLGQLYDEPSTVTKQDKVETIPYFLSSEFSEINVMESHLNIKHKLDKKDQVKKTGNKSSFLIMKQQQQEDRKKIDKRKLETKKSEENKANAQKKPKDEVEFYKERIEFLMSEL